MARRKTPAVPSDQDSRCSATRKRDGKPCTAKARFDGSCIGHREGAAEARRKGGAATSNVAKLQRLLPTELQPTVEMLIQTMTAVRAGKVAPAVGTALASMANALIKVLDSGETSERLKAIEEKLDGGGDHHGDD